MANTVSVGKILVATESASVFPGLTRNPGSGSQLTGWDDTLGTATASGNEASTSATPEGTPEGDSFNAQPRSEATKEGVTFKDPTIGSGKITASELGVVITNNQVTDNSRIFIQATSPTAGQTLIVTKKRPFDPAQGAKGSFAVEIELPTESDITFDYWIIN